MSSALLKQEGLSSCDTKEASRSAYKSDRVAKLKSTNSKATRAQCVHNLKQTLDGNKLCNENVTKLLNLSKNSIQIAAVEKIVKRAHKGRYSEVAIPKVQQESVFTEEDFQAFERDYASKTT